jgi:hypothetical protein
MWEEGEMWTGMALPDVMQTVSTCATPKIHFFPEFNCIIKLYTTLDDTLGK